MTLEERRERERAEVRQRLLDAATRVLTREGPGALSLRKVAAEAEYAPATLYLYFTGREDLLRQWARMGFGQFLARIAEIPAEVHADPERLVAEVLRAYVRFALDNAGAMRVSMRPEVRGLTPQVSFDSPEFLASPGHALVAGALVRLAGQGALRADDVPMATASLWCGLAGLAANLLDQDQLAPPWRERFIEFHVQALIRGVLAASSVGQGT